MQNQNRHTQDIELLRDTLKNDSDNEKLLLKSKVEDLSKELTAIVKDRDRLQDFSNMLKIKISKSHDEQRCCKFNKIHDEENNDPDGLSIRSKNMTKMSSSRWFKEQKVR